MPELDGQPTDPVPILQTDPNFTPAMVEIHNGPWVTGTRALHYFGSLSVAVKMGSDIDASLHEAVGAMQVKAFHLGANSIVGAELTIDPFATPPLITIVGTAAKLVPMFG